MLRTSRFLSAGTFQLQKLLKSRTPLPQGIFILLARNVGGALLFDLHLGLDLGKLMKLAIERALSHVPAKCLN